MTPQELASVPSTAVKARKFRTEGKTHVQEVGSLSRQVCSGSFLDACVLISTLVGDDLRTPPPPAGATKQDEQG